MEIDRKYSLMPAFLVLLVSLFLLSALPNILTEYPKLQDDARTPRDPTGDGTDEPPPVLLFRVSPATPQLFWRVSSADYYTGFHWLTTTDEEVLEEFPQLQDDNATRIFTVELNSSQHEISLPLASSNSAPSNMSIESYDDVKFYVDNMADVYKISKLSQTEEVKLTYNVLWHDIEVNEKLVSIENIPEEISEKYLQLPDLSSEVWNLAEALKDPSYGILDQILADVQYFRSDFVYDLDSPTNLQEVVLQAQGSDVSSYIKWKRGICIDAATALTVILRMQKIPARIGLGYNPGAMREGKLLFYTTEGHAVTEVYLPPYGWVQFDATPPLEKVPLVRVLPFKKESSPGSRLFYQISITNRRNETDNFRLFVESKQKWNISAIPEKLRLEGSKTADALFEITIPESANLGDKDVIAIKVASLHHSEVAFSIKAIAQAENIPQISTTTSLDEMDEATIRGNTFRVKGTVLTADDERVNNMTIFVLLTKSKESEGVVVGKGYSEQGDFEIESAVPDFVEIGDYKLIPISLGTTQCTPSSAVGFLRVRATTRIELGSETEFLMRYGAMHGRLSWDNGSGYPGQPISLEMTSLNTSSGAWKSQNLTLDDGSFRVETTFAGPGTYEVKAVFSGNDHVMGSTATQLVKLKQGTPAIHISAEKTAIRGEIFKIKGEVQFEDLGIWGEPVALTLDNKLLGNTETRDNGSYTWSFIVDPNEKLGVHTLTVTLENGDLYTVHQIAVKSKTTLATKVSNTAGGMFLLVSASLYDDHGMPIDGVSLSVDNYGLSWTTKEDENSTFLLDTVRFWPENLVLTTRFEGSELYLPASIEKEVFLEPIISIPFVLPLVSPLLTVIIFLYAKHLIDTKKMLQQTIAHEAVAEGKGIVDYEHEKIPKKTQAFEFFLPDIAPEFPNVWGVKEKLRVQISPNESVLKKIPSGDIAVFVNKENIASVAISQQGLAEVSHTFATRGEYKIRAVLPRTTKLPPLDAELGLRAVEYEEEIVRLYNLFLKKLAQYNIDLGDEMTAREIERLVLSTYGQVIDFSQEALRKITICFEKAEYSNRLMLRKDYETLFLSLKELNVNVE